MVIVTGVQFIGDEICLLFELGTAILPSWPSSRAAFLWIAYYYFRVQERLFASSDKFYLLIVISLIRFLVEIQIMSIRFGWWWCSLDLSSDSDLVLSLIDTRQPAFSGKQSVFPLLYLCELVCTSLLIWFLCCVALLLSSSSLDKPSGFRTDVQMVSYIQKAFSMLLLPSCK